MTQDHRLHGFNYNVEAWDADGLHYETLAICRQLAYARAVFKAAIEEKPTGKFMIRSHTRSPLPYSGARPKRTSAVLN